MKTNSFFEQTTKEERTTSVFIHLSSFVRYIIPFGGLIATLIFWSFNRDKPFTNEHGRQAVNFQLSLLLYKFILLLLCVPTFIFLLKDLVSLSEIIESADIFAVLSLSTSSVFFLIILLLFSAITIFEIISVIVAAIKASEGSFFRYPLSINFTGRAIQNDF